MKTGTEALQHFFSLTDSTFVTPEEGQVTMEESTIPGTWKIIVKRTVMSEMMLRLTKNFNVVFSERGYLVLTLKTTN